MPSLPTVGGSNNTWGTELNAFLSVSHNPSTGEIDAGTDVGLDSTLDRVSYIGKAHVRTATDGRNAVQLLEGTVRGTSEAGPADTLFGLAVDVADATGVGNWTVSGAVNNGSGLIRLTATGHGVNTGDSVGVYGVGGVTAANGHWVVTKIDANTVDLQASTFSGTYTSGGTLTNRGAFYGAMMSLSPNVVRGGLTGTAEFGDDVVGYGVFNAGGQPASAGYLVNRNSAFGANPEFYQAIEIECNATIGLRMIGAYDWGIDLSAGGVATYSSGAIRLPNNVPVYAPNGAGSADISLFRFSTTNEFQLLTTTRLGSELRLTDGANVDLGTTNGTKIGLGASQKLGFFNATPVVQPSTTGTSTGFTAGGGTAVNDQSTFTGAVGSTAYRISDIVKALKDLGLLAA